MKTILKSIIFILFIAVNLTAFAQVGINNNTPAASAALDVTSTEGGILIPRLTETQRDAITLPATGLMIFQTDQTAGFYFYDGTAWAQLGAPAAAVGAASMLESERDVIDSPVAGLTVWCADCGPNGEMQVYNGLAWTNISGSVAAIYDNVLPVITISVGNSMDVVINGSYLNPSATAMDNVDGDISSAIVVAGAVDTTTYGAYPVTYNVSDASGNAAQEQTLTVNIVAGPETVVIGAQEWTLRNAEHVTYRDGTAIPQVTDQTAWNNLTTGAWCYYNNDSAFGDTYGKLYNWYAIAGIYDEASLNDDTLRKEFAPEGYHVPTNQEQTDLKVHLGSDINGANIGYKLKSTGNTSDGTGLWSGSQPATNESGWTGLPSGIRNGGVFMQVHDASIFWSSEAQTSTLAYMNLLHASTNAMQNGAYNIDRACSVRLIKE
ncbi:hypothetical protein BST83_00525 [Polaribacter filamentus]|uniref:Pesticidal crystal protein Cry22Aa Ig-like domain-containing protein n=1 Tax=Polaribacter filamentus TaxID=53483 RepID=A0A2S7L226_9FLAO|nr:FISUMP domain-containing protein [Polaribacter filamentus]PQB08886.1 hypothetical protein BST83_00525 [Polaribacter filamentus]